MAVNVRFWRKAIEHRAPSLTPQPALPQHHRFHDHEAGEFSLQFFEPPADGLTPRPVTFL